MCTKHMETCGPGDTDVGDGEGRRRKEERSCESVSVSEMNYWQEKKKKSFWLTVQLDRC